ncbi:MAG: hypothetical protein DCC51_07965 [Anaerolineae bacterium]|nr:MAG: hypothetical protein DCC51_07965 [Anaerolineae bacterium]
MGTIVKSSETVELSKQTLAEAAIQADQDAKALALEGSEMENAGITTLREAGDVLTIGTAAVAAGASDLTRAVDAAVVADRLSTLSEIVETAGIDDISQGADLIAHSEDVETMSAIVGLMSYGDLERGLELARLAGELEAVSHVTDALEMPVLTVFLSDRGAHLKKVAVDVIMQAAATRSLSQVMSDTGRKIGDLGENEVDEGVVRLMASDAAAQRAEELAVASNLLATRGAVEVGVAVAADELVRGMVAEGASELAAGAADMAASESLDDLAQTLAANAE